MHRPPPDPRQPCPMPDGDAPLVSLPESRLSLVPLALWVVAVLAYPVAFVVALCGSPQLGLAAVALPEIVVRGLLRLHVLVWSVAVWGAAVGGGMTLLRRTGFACLTMAERAVFGGALGMGVLSLGTFVLGTVSGFGPPWLLVVLLAAMLVAMALAGLRDLVQGAAAAAQGLRAWRRRATLRGVLLVVLGLGIVGFALTRAHVPVVADYDSLEYHLAAPAQWWRAGTMLFLRDVVYSNFPQNAVPRTGPPKHVIDSR